LATLLRLFPESANSDARRLVWAKSLRAIGDGYVSVLLPAYLILLGRHSIDVGVLTTATLVGSATLTVFSARMVGRWGHRRPLLAASGLMILTGVAFATLHEFWPLLVIAFVGTINPSSGDVSVFLPLEQSLLSRSVDAADRTALFARYSLAGSLMGAVGALLAAAPDLLERRLGVGPLAAIEAMFLLYAATGAGAAALYWDLSDRRRPDPERIRPLGQSRGIVYRLTALFCVDALGGGFFVQTILALWLLEQFHLPFATTATILFWTNLLSAGSYLAAVPIARRFGLINTMVFTHLPSNLCLIAIPFVSHIGVVVGRLLLRSLLSQMDVPTRTSYVMAVVTPEERPAAASLTTVPRSLASAISPAIAGYLIAASSFAWPLLIGGLLKTGYDLTLLAMFRHLRPPEEDRPANTGADSATPSHK
jgi:MFS family permease